MACLYTVCIASPHITFPVSSLHLPFMFISIMVHGSGVMAWWFSHLQPHHMSFMLNTSNMVQYLLLLLLLSPLCCCWAGQCINRPRMRDQPHQQLKEAAPLAAGGSTSGGAAAATGAASSCYTPPPGASALAPAAKRAFNLVELNIRGGHGVRDRVSRESEGEKMQPALTGSWRCACLWNLAAWLAAA